MTPQDATNVNLLMAPIGLLWNITNPLEFTNVPRTRPRPESANSLSPE